MVFATVIEPAGKSSNCAVGRGVGGEFLQSGELGNVTGTSREPPDNCRFGRVPNL
jgi:hypothetical protein